MSERIRGSYDVALYKSTYTTYYFTVCMGVGFAIFPTVVKCQHKQ